MSKISNAAKCIRDTSRHGVYSCLAATLAGLCYMFVVNGGDLDLNMPGTTFNVIRFFHHVLFLALNVNNYVTLRYLYPRLNKGKASGWCFCLHCVRKSQPVGVDKSGVDNDDLGSSFHFVDSTIRPSNSQSK